MYHFVHYKAILPTTSESGYRRAMSEGSMSNDAIEVKSELNQPGHTLTGSHFNRNIAEDNRRGPCPHHKAELNPPHLPTSI